MEGTSQPIPHLLTAALFLAWSQGSKHSGRNVHALVGYDGFQLLPHPHPSIYPSVTYSSSVIHPSIHPPICLNLSPTKCQKPLGA